MLLIVMQWMMHVPSPPQPKPSLLSVTARCMENVFLSASLLWDALHLCQWWLECGYLTNEVDDSTKVANASYQQAAVEHFALRVWFIATPRI